MAGMKSSTMSARVFNMHGMGWTGVGVGGWFNKLISKAQYIIVSRYCI